MRKNKQSARSLIAFLVTWSFVILTVTGIVLYIVPQGRIAFWSNWSLLGLGKEQWGNVHMMFGGVFIVTGFLHLYFNWKPFKKYFADRVAGHLEIKREILVSLVISSAILVMSVANLPPVKWVFDLNAAVKDAWVSSPEKEPPFGHAEQVSLAGLARRMDLDLERGLAELKRRGIEVAGPDESLERIAEANGSSPAAIYGLISGFQQTPVIEPAAVLTPEAVEEHYAGTGLGRKSIREVSDKAGVEVGVALERLTAAGMEVAADDKLKPVAEEYGLTPIDLIKIILIPDFRLATD